MIMKVFSILVLSLTLSLGLSAANKKAKDKLPKVFVEKLQVKEIFNQVTYIGNVKPVREAKIYAPVEGVLIKMLAKPGVPVKRGEPLAIIKQNVIGLEMLPVKIKAPVAGNLCRSRVSENQLVGKNQELFSIYDPSEYKVEINISPADSKLIKIADELDIKIGDKMVKGTISSISPDIDFTSGTKMVEIKLDKKASNLSKGQIAEAIFNFNKRQGFLISNKFLKKKGRKNYIRLLSKDNKVKEIEIKIKDRIKSAVEIEHAELVDDQEIITKSSVEPLLNEQSVEVIKKEKL